MSSFINYIRNLIELYIAYRRQPISSESIVRARLYSTINADQAVHASNADQLFYPTATFPLNKRVIR